MLPRLIKMICRSFVMSDFQAFSLATIWFVMNWNNTICSGLESSELIG